MDTPPDNAAPSSATNDLLTFVALIEILKTLALPVFTRSSGKYVPIANTFRGIGTVVPAFCAVLLLLCAGCIQPRAVDSVTGIALPNTTTSSSPLATQSIPSVQSSSPDSDPFGLKSPDPIIAEFLIGIFHSADRNRTPVCTQFVKFLTALPKGSQVVFITFSRKPIIVGEAGGLQNAKKCLYDILRSTDTWEASVSHQTDDGTDICAAIDLANADVANAKNNSGHESKVHLILWTDLFADASRDTHGHKVYYRNPSAVTWPASARTNTDVTVFGADPSQLVYGVAAECSRLP